MIKIKTKSLYLLFIIYYLSFHISSVFSSSSSSSSCNICKNVGEECISSDSCLNNSVCVYPSVVYNETTSIKKCITYGKLNEKCYENQCADGLFCEFDNYPAIESGTCRNLRYSQIGEKCTDLKDCSSFFANCIDGICVSNRNSCSVNFDCPFNYFCNSSIPLCLPFKKINESCMDSTNCAFGSFCSKTTNKCQKYFTLELNESCDKESPFECNSISSDLYCSSKGICEKYTSSIECSVPTLNQSSCNNYIDSSICGCDKKCHSLNNINIKSSKPIEDLSNCFNKYNCTFIRNIQSSKSCIYKYCSREYCSYLSLIKENDNYFSTCSSSNSIQSLHICNSSYSSSDIDSVNNSNKSYYINNQIKIIISLITLIIIVLL